VIGCGLMGSGIAEVSARAGLEVVVVEGDDALAERGRARIVASLDRGASKGKLTEAERDEARDLIEVTSDIGAVEACDLVIEAVAEDEEVKLPVFRQLDEVVKDEGAVLASNTSSLPIMKLAMATERPGSVVGIHFFNPVPVQPLVELVPSLLTSDATLAGAGSYAERLGKQVITSKDRAGFVVNALLVPYLLSAVRMLESGFASAEDIDRGMVLGCAHPQGPLALSDLVGLDTLHHVAESLYEEFREPHYAPPPLLSRMVDAGLLGRKSGRGFHDYAGR
jgi:3-hydroxybutyryl-CoA dehydrogenase